MAQSEPPMRTDAVRLTSSSGPTVLRSIASESPPVVVVGIVVEAMMAPFWLPIVPAPPQVPPCDRTPARPGTPRVFDSGAPVGVPGGGVVQVDECPPFPVWKSYV